MSKTQSAKRYATTHYWLLNGEQVIYETLPPSSRRLVNQAIFVALIACDPETIQTKRTPLYESLAKLNRALQQAQKAPQTAPKRPRTPQNKALRAPTLFRGRGSYMSQMAGRAGRRSNPNLVWKRISEPQARRYG